ncbi:Uncharacterised protein [Vibrio cholerae]|nr:Uncharacterised protein [Vibrio cholerae]
MTQKFYVLDLRCRKRELNRDRPPFPIKYAHKLQLFCMRLLFLSTSNLSDSILPLA